MKNLIVILTCTFLFSCTNNTSSTLALESVSGTLNNDYEERFNSIEAAYKHENMAKDKLYYSFYDLDSAYKTATSILSESKSATEVTSIIEEFNAYAFELSSAASLNNRTIEQIPTTDFISFGLMELAISAKKALGEMAMMIGASDVKFDKIRAFVEYNSNSIKLGEEFEAKLYFTATASKPIKDAYYLVNNDTLQIIDNYGYLKFKPTKAGISELNFRIGAHESSILTQYNMGEQKVLLEVK